MKYRTVLLILSLILLAVLILAVALLSREPEIAPDNTVITTQITAPVQREDKLVGICLPSQAEEWMDTGHLLKSRLESKGYRVELACGDGTAKSQENLLNALMDKGVDCLIATPVDSTTLTDAESAAKEKGIPILAYGSLLMDSDAVSGYICYDYFEMGAEVARYIEESLALSTAAQENRSHTVEFFMGAPKDYNAVLLHKGLLSVLQAYLDNGVLQSKSGRLAFEDICIPGWSEETATQNCLNRLQHSYSGTAPDVCICASDSLASGIITALSTAGVTEENWPLVTGNGATKAGMDSLAAGKLALTIRTDAADPAAVCSAMVDKVLFDIAPEFSLGEVFNNVISVPTALCGFELIY